MYDNYVFVDTETTGFKENRIVSIGFIAYQDGKRIAKENIFVNPNAKIEDGAYKIHGISQEDVSKFPTFDYTWKQIKQYFKNATWIAHNLKYDQKAIIGELTRYGLEIPHYSTICTYENAKKIIPKTDIKNYKLDTVAQYLDINFSEEQHHDSFFDTVACMRIYNKLIDLSDGDLIVKEENM